MKVPFTWRPTGWFMIGFSADFTPGTVKPLEYLGQHLVAYRTADGVLTVLDAHCPHLGAHLGHRGKVNGDCVECPYHGWGFGPDGVNKYIPYEDRPNVSKALRSWPVKEQHEWVFMWHDPAGGPPRWDMPSVFEFDGVADDPADYYRGYPEHTVVFAGEPVHPQIPLENAPDGEHFHYVHKANVIPYLTSWEVDGPFYRSTAGWPVSDGHGGTRLALSISNLSCGVGGSMSRFEGNTGYRLAFFTTPIDDETSDMFYSIWWPKGEDPSDVPPDDVRELVHKQFMGAPLDDLEIWRHQVYVEHPALAQKDAKPYGALRKWARQFYEVDPVS